MLQRSPNHSISSSPPGASPPGTISPASASRGMGQLWVAVLCIFLSQILGALWLWSLISSRPIH